LREARAGRPCYLSAAKISSIGVRPASKRVGKGFAAKDNADFDAHGRVSVLSPPASSEADLKLAELAQADDRIQKFRRNGKMKTIFFRSLLLLMAIATCSVIAAAGPKGHDLRADRRDIRTDTRNIRHDRRDMGRDARERRADVRDYRNDKKDGASKQELRSDRRDISGDTRDLRGDRRDLRKDVRDRRGDVRDLRGDKKEPGQ
jgi:hypothetical protein